jgi:predicted DNA-binding transcriptional regulator YafY
MGLGEKISRQWRILLIIASSRHGVRAAQLADKLDCQLRNIYRDIYALQNAGFPLYNERSNDKKFKVWKLLTSYAENQKVYEKILKSRIGRPCKKCGSFERET